ncbi:MAG: hypothetical protein P8186_02540, partial [Anaerolineae bacterium]
QATRSHFSSIPRERQSVRKVFYTLNLNLPGPLARARAGSLSLNLNLNLPGPLARARAGSLNLSLVFYPLTR